MSSPRSISTLLTLVTLTGLGACTGADAAAPSDRANSPAPCHVGDFDVRSLELPALFDLGLDAAATGGSMRVRFDGDGSWTVNDDGSRPMTIDVGPATARLRIDGAATGRYARRGTSWELWQTGADATMTLSGPLIGRTTVELDDADGSLMPDGKVRIDCDANRVSMASDDGDIVMTLTRT